MRSGAPLDRKGSGSSVAPSTRVPRPTVAGWQLPYLRVALILRHLRAGEAWLKVTLCRLPRMDAGVEAWRSLHDEAIRANPSRILWGSDWPYVRMSPAPDAGAMLDLFLDWVGDDALARRILVDNPASLFGFND